jgi:8-oxo-dGTP pyrophosphatase MutT (NUDIX family)
VADSPPASAQKVVRGPRPAATVLVLRGGPRIEQPSLFMVRRSAQSPFMPETLVFPGGRVDAADGASGAAGPSDAAFEQAARRECLEEAAIDLGQRPLHWFDTWLTPSAEPRRYLARFFIARVDPDEGHEARPDGHETTEGMWASAPEVLARWEEGQADLPPPTLSILLRLAAGGWEALLERDAQPLRAPILPKVAPRGNALHILMPHHPEYANVPGEAGTTPERVHELPRGFVRDEKRWRPSE